MSGNRIAIYDKAYDIINSVNLGLSINSPVK